MGDAPYWEVCDGDGPYLLLIHGFLSSKAQWLLNLEALGRVCRPVLFELYGHGASPAPADAQRYETGSYVAAIEAIRERLGVERWFVCGYSLGAAISIRYALTHPASIHGHIFTNSASAFADAALADSWRANASAAAARIRSGGQAALERIAVHPKHARRLPPAVYDALVADAESISPEGVANAMERTMPTASVRGDLQRNTRPALLIQGRFEKRFAPHRAFAERAMPHLEVVAVDSGHAVNMQAADAFNAAAASFIATHAP